MDTDIKKVQAKELEMLEAVDRFCRENGIQYTLSSGSLLGAVRHQGFIPWDDDIDIAMTRENYEKFIALAKDRLPKPYFLQHISTEKQCPNLFAKVRNSDTTCISIEHTALDINHGLGLDVFPVDRFSGKKPKLLAFRAKLFNMLRGINDKPYRDSITSASKKCVAYLLLPLTKLITRRRLILWEDRLNKRMHRKGGEFTTADVIFRNKILDYKIFSEYEDITFEGKTLMCIKRKEDYLKNVYGDYLSLPPENKRIPAHKVAHLDLNMSYNDYVSTRRH